MRAAPKPIRPIGHPSGAATEGTRPSLFATLQMTPSPFYTPSRQPLTPPPTNLAPHHQPLSFFSYGPHAKPYKPNPSRRHPPPAHTRRAPLHPDTRRLLTASHRASSSSLSAAVYSYTRAVLRAATFSITAGRFFFFSFYFFSTVIFSLFLLPHFTDFSSFFFNS